jgi:hypothetical protein
MKRSEGFWHGKKAAVHGRSHAQKAAQTKEGERADGHRAAKQSFCSVS